MKEDSNVGPRLILLIVRTNVTDHEIRVKGAGGSGPARLNGGYKVDVRSDDLVVSPSLRGRLIGGTASAAEDKSEKLRIPDGPQYRDPLAGMHSTYFMEPGSFTRAHRDLTEEFPINASQAFKVEVFGKDPCTDKLITATVTYQP